MSRLTVVRHGQASFLAENYDKLSALGERQARLLGEYWVARGKRFDRAYTGPAERQRRTAEIVRGVYRRAGRAFPELECDADFDEFPAEPVVRTFLPLLSRRYPHLAAAVEAFEAASELREKQKLFDRVLRETCNRWLAGEVGSPEIPTWPDFCHRIEAALRRVTREAGEGSETVLFTSGGPTAATVRVALGLSYQATLDLAWSPRNASFAEFRFNPERLSLCSFNAVPHLDAEELLTWR